MTKQVIESRFAFMKKSEKHPGVKTFAVPFMTTKVKVYTPSPNSDYQSESGCLLCSGDCGAKCGGSCWGSCYGDCDDDCTSSSGNGCHLCGSLVDFQ